MAHATLEEIYLGLADIVKAVDPSIPMGVRGVPPPSIEGKNEWITFELLSIFDTPARRFTVEKHIDIQVTVYSLHAEYRSDHKFSAMYSLASRYAAIFDRKDILIKSSCISFGENRIVPLDLRSIGDFAKDIIQQLPPLHTMASVILNHGCINSYKGD